mgnify:CR=1 FL=1
MAAELHWDSWPGFSAAAMAGLEEYQWPGNVRELGNMADRFVLGLLNDAPASEASLDLPTLLKRFEKNLIEDALLRALDSGHLGGCALDVGSALKRASIASHSVSG